MNENKLFKCSASRSLKTFLRKHAANRLNDENKDLVVRLIKLITMRFFLLSNALHFLLALWLFLHHTRTSRLSDLVTLMHTRVKLMNLQLHCDCKLCLIFVNKSLVVNDNAFRASIFNLFYLCRRFILFWSANSRSRLVTVPVSSQTETHKTLRRMKMKSGIKLASCCVCGCVFCFVLWEMFSSFCCDRKTNLSAGFLLITPRRRTIESGSLRSDVF